MFIRLNRLCFVSMGYQIRCVFTLNSAVNKKIQCSAVLNTTLESMHLTHFKIYLNILSKRFVRANSNNKTKRYLGCTFNIRVKNEQISSFFFCFVLFFGYVYISTHILRISSISRARTIEGEEKRDIFHLWNG